MITTILPRACVTLVSWLVLTMTLTAQTLIPSTVTRDAAHRVKVSFSTTAGKNYRVERTADFVN